MSDDDTYEGCFTITPKLDPETVILINGLLKTRRMKRDPQKLAQLLGITSQEAINQYGPDGELYFNPADFPNHGQTKDDSIVDYNLPPANQPSLWLHWKLDPQNPDADYSTLSWDGSSKFRNPEEWIEYLINVLQLCDYTVNGKVKWYGAGHHLDAGYIKVVDNVVSGGMLYI